MAVTLDDIKALRTKTGAGMSDCKKALTEAEGDFEKAIEIIRKKGLAVAAKRSDLWMLLLLLRLSHLTRLRLCLLRARPLLISFWSVPVL